MSTAAGVFSSQADAERAAQKLAGSGLAKDKIVLLGPDGAHKNGQPQRVPTSDTEQPGMGAALGGVVGGAVGVAGGLQAGAAVAAAIPGVGPVIAMGLLGAAVLGIAGVGVGAAAGSAFEDATAKGLPADEWFVYEDALRKGRSVLLAFPDQESAESVRAVMLAEGAESIDNARQQWWIGLRSAEMETYSQTGRGFDRDEKFYRLGFEAALHARNRCLDDDQAASERETKLEQLRPTYSGADLEEPFRRGYERGREYYRDFCRRSGK